MDLLLEANHTALYSESMGNTPLWITLTTEKYNDAVYVNNARLILSQSNFKAKNHQNKEQVWFSSLASKRCLFMFDRFCTRLMKC